jgi:ankyrin repeat protein
MDLLAYTESSEEARKVHLGLKPSSKHLYTEIFDKIDQLPKKERRLTQGALAWLVFAKLPLKGLQLRHALASRPGTFELGEAQIPEMEEIIALCGSLMIYDKENDACELSHVSVSEFVRENLLEWELVAVASGCLTYLSLHDFGTGRCESNALFESRLKRYPLYAYAATYWGDHLRNAPLESVLTKTVRSFLSSPNKITAASQAILSVTTHGHRSRDHDQSVDPQYSAFHLAAYFGLCSVTKMLLEEGQRPNSKDHEGRTPLWLATELKKHEIMTVLSSVDRKTFTLMLDKGEKILASSLLLVTGNNIRDSRQRTPLHISALISDDDFMLLAIRCGVDMDAKDTDGYTAINLALQNSAVPAIDLLLKNGADTSTVNCNQWLEAYQKLSPHIVELSRHTSGPKEVRFPTKEEVKSAIPLRRKDTQRLM